MLLTLIYIIIYPILPLYKFTVLFILSLMRGVRRIHHGYNWFDNVSDQIVLGGAPLFFFHDDDFIEDNHITAILNICPEAPPYDKRHFKLKKNYLFLRVFDRTAPTLHQLKKGVKWLDDKIDNGEKILVHCAVGAMRSVTFVTAWHMYAYGWGLEEALSYVKQKRPQAHPNRKQLHRLKEFSQLIQNGQFVKK